ncbi:glycosyltransferase family 25 protein [Psychrobacter sp. HD31]|uniref:glycosyltransferase family 25 protein n=1 Tax=Psychrobacter sp. HD31 TaxID=3112003 RepID=UPI003DA23399
MSHNFVISLKKAQSRRQHINDVFTKANVSFDFFDAIEPSFGFLDKFDLSLDSKQKVLEEGEIACLLSHFSLWQRAIDEGFDFITIFEDDIYLGENANSFLSSYDWIPDECHLIKLEAFKPYRPMLQNKIPLAYNRKLGILLERHLGGAGYIISKKLAQDLINYTKHQQALPALDYLLFDPFFINEVSVFNKVKAPYHIHQLQPALCVQDMKLSLFTNDRKPSFSSQIHRETFSINKKLYSENKSLKSKLKQELHKALYRKKDSIDWV